MIDWNRVAELREEVGPEDFAEVVDLFLQEVDEEIQKLSTMMPQDGLSEKLHFLKGGALSLGFSEFSSLCATAEAALTRNPAAAFDIDRLHQSYQSARRVFLSDLPQKFAS
jgi:HPt (histidine-containing phosphotransfer) domain-containing protein